MYIMCDSVRQCRPLSHTDSMTKSSVTYIVNILFVIVLEACFQVLAKSKEHFIKTVTPHYI